MDAKLEVFTRLQEPLAGLLDAATQVWVNYQSAGPGRVDRALYDPVEAACTHLGEVLEDRKLIESIEDRLHGLGGHKASL